MKFDLHVHTNHSDGLFSPEEVVDLAVEKNLNGIAITDHDTITAIEPAIIHGKNYEGFTVIPGIEFSSTHLREEIHILGYFINVNDPNIIDLTARLRRSRVNRGIAMIGKLNELGISLSLEDVREFSGDDYIGRPHIARALIKMNYISTIEEAFDKYLGSGKPAYVYRDKLTVEETIKAIKDSGGISVLAHPGILKNKDFIFYTIEKGIDGIECIHSKHSKDDTSYLQEIAKNNNLIITGGSDFHGDTGSNVDNNSLLGQYFVDINKISAFRERI
ncbi:MAG: PHP domain-containing protein [Tissierellaceae bacterium]